MNVNDRKMFKPRPARNQLNQLGGIMASSPQLVDTVARFQQGGNVSLAQMQQANDPRFFARLGANVANLPAAAYDTLVGFPASTLQNVASAVQYSPFGRALGMSEFGETAPPTVGAQPAQAGIRDILQANQPLTPEQVAMRAQPPGTGIVPPEGAADAQMSAQLGQDVFGESYGMTEEVDPFMMPGVTPSPMPAEQEQAAVVEPPAPPQMPMQTQQQEMPAESPEVIAAAKRGELGAAEQVKAVVQQGTPQEQEQSLSQLMSEFTQNAPEFKGTDRGLAMAKIGFAMAAGQSPNAITNIANALNEGADELIKDKRERDSFNRQVQLSALQYGLGEIGKQRAQDRTDQRTMREFVAGQDGIEYNGETYGEGETILVSQADILANNGRLPKGLQDKAVFAAGVKAAADRQKATTDLISDLRKEAILPDTTATALTKDYKGAVSNFQSSELGVQLLENAILDVAEGDVTGFANGFESAMNKVANAAGIKLDDRFQSAEEFKGTMRRAFQLLIPTTLGEAQSANSISDRDVTFLADAFVNSGALENGVFSLAFVDEDVLAQQLQGAIGEFRRSQQTSLSTMSQIERRVANRVLPGTREAAGTLLDPFRESMRPYMPEQTGTQSGLVKGEDGVFRFQ